MESSDAARELPPMDARDGGGNSNSNSNGDARANIGLFSVTCAWHMNGKYSLHHSSRKALEAATHKHSNGPIGEHSLLGDLTCP